MSSGGQNGPTPFWNSTTVPMRAVCSGWSSTRSSRASPCPRVSHPAAWAKKAVLFLLSLGSKDNGKPREVRVLPASVKKLSAGRERGGDAGQY